MLDRIGVLSALFAYTAWGFFPLYWQLLTHLSSLEILCHRVIWSFFFYYSASKLWIGKEKTRSYFRDRKFVLQISLASFFIGFNWLLYVWAVTHGHVMESSLGYFINPLINVALGALLLKETLSRNRRIALAFAMLGVSWLTFVHGRLPMIAIGLAVSFASYGFMKKILRAPATVITVAETAILLPLAVCVMVLFRFCFAQFEGSGFLRTVPVLAWSDWLLLIGGGVITGLPLLLFGVAAKRLPMTSLGFFQFLSPTFQFLTAIFFFHEPLDAKKLFGFVLIWLGLIIFLGDSLRKKRR